ncbi:hypothetical protein AMAG_11479 [Allomyces macrogynus ATCC 38327]|uniref:NAD(P)-binding domain-containing protein n=1 Tax=Allomyces macrogynus (strain ATCC 38327) TaxID=578462 RepID=A0A0L0SXF7_ALLM3|nr:hypothetical protein AMAG_11479 [Allomyces macrogynus ATCC 38327]|eukprot:KNE67014.1 hypothetical protein AMAG_11479 [Allomyces macrogynus ATCC 38327]
MNTLVIHADTYTGGYAARALVADPGFKVRVAARRKESVEDLVRAGAEFSELAHSPPTQDDVDNILRGVYDAVLVIAPTQRARDDALTWVNALSKAENLRRVVVLSVYRADRGQNLVYLAEVVRSQAVIALPLGAPPGATVAPVNLKDVGQAVRTVLTQRKPHAFATYDLTGPQLLTGEAMARLLTRQYGVEFVYLEIKPSAMRQILHTLPGVTETEVDLAMLMYQDMVDGYHNKVSPDLQKLLDVVKDKAETLEEFFHEFRPETAQVQR